jgi:hypothetical protein
MTTTDRAPAAAAAPMVGEVDHGRDYVAFALGLLAAALVVIVEIAALAGLWIGLTAVS